MPSRYQKMTRTERMLGTGTHAKWDEFESNPEDYMNIARRCGKCKRKKSNNYCSFCNQYVSQINLRALVKFENRLRKMYHDDTQLFDIVLAGDCKEE